MANFAAAAGQAAIRVGTQVAVNAATDYITNALDTTNTQGPKLDGFHLQTSRDGAPMARVFGRVRLAGQVIWASHVREIATEEPVGGKGGGPTQTNFSYTISFAIGLCEGEIAGVDRIWANGAPLETAGLDMRIYSGTEDQQPDPIIAATEGREAPAFRSTAYVVFEDFPLDGFGNRLPQLNLEVVRVGRGSGKLESLVQSVNLLPGSGEFAYATDIVEVSPRPGQTRPVNLNNLAGKADIELALDQLQAQLPNCRNVSIISSWFASGTEIADCVIRPGVEQRVLNVRNAQWQVGRDDRGSAYLVSQDDDDRPNYGGTPSDKSLIQAIRAIKARGMTVTLYPFILVDAPGFPWRGRITGGATDVRAFFGHAVLADYSLGAGEDHHRSEDRGFRNFILTHANLARRAGGVDRFVIGSEMVGLTTIRDSANGFPAVTELARLAGDVKAMLGPQAALTYAADWSEYFGYHPQDGSGDIFFHLDELWSHPAIEAVGIDAYFPLSDWRDGTHLDAQDYADTYDPDYLSANVEGGEGYDWYYASQHDRDSQIRTPITDWVYRYKDLRHWWSTPHRNRIGGVWQDPTDWVPESKPFWLTEVGCPAVRYGANQPNLFSDDKSIESNTPYYSNGSRDDLIQRRYLEALIGYWSDPQNNTRSTLTDQRMIDMSATSVWAWDARPYPDFPARRDVWADGENWKNGHWINGRVGAVPLGEVVAEICADCGLEDVDVSALGGLVSGLHIDRPMRARDALMPLLETHDILLAESDGKVRFVPSQSESSTTLMQSDLVEAEGGPVRFSVEEDMTALRDVRLSFIDASRDYQTAVLSARNELAETVRVADIRAPLVLDPAQAKLVVQRHLARSEPARRRAEFALPPTVSQNLQVGSRLRLPETDGVWQIQRLRHGLKTDVDAVRLPDLVGEDTALVAGVNPRETSIPAWISEPVVLGFDLPGQTGLQLGVLMTPFRPADLTLVGDSSEIRANATAPLLIGALLSPLPAASAALWDRNNAIDVWMPNARLVAVSEMDALAGANRFALETPLGWEVIGAADVTLIAPDTYRFQTLLRGLSGSDDMIAARLEAGARIIRLDDGVMSLPLDDDYVGQNVKIEVMAGGRAGVAAEVRFKAAAQRPLSVIHVKAEPSEGGIRLSWIPRTFLGSGTSAVRVAWEGGSITATDREVILPLASGANVRVTLTATHPVAGPGRPVEIFV